MSSFVLAALPSEAHAQMSFDRCVDQLRAELPQHPRLRADTFALHTRNAQDLRPPIAAASRSQPEFSLPVWDYLARLVDDKRIRDGKEILQREAGPLARISTRQGVDPHTVVAIFGVESDFGRLPGRYPVVDATLSRACMSLANKERKAHFFAALWLLQEGLVRPEEFRGSWAGAFGMTQFMPGTLLRYMTDGDGDGVIDTVRSAGDALATTANYLKSLGWTEGLPWGIEVNAPHDIARLASSSEREHLCLAAQEPQARCRRMDQWAALGLVRADSQALAASGSAWPALVPATPMALLTPAGPNGPAWLVTRNFQVAWQYNHADAYALAIGLLTSALRDEPPLRAAWPTSEAQEALSRTGMAALQGLLRQAGHCGLVIDGYDGPLSRQAIRDEERRRGLPESGRPTTTLLELMRAGPSTGRTACAAEPPPPAAPMSAEPVPDTPFSPTAPIDPAPNPL